MIPEFNRAKIYNLLGTDRKVPTHDNHRCPKPFSNINCTEKPPVTATVIRKEHDAILVSILFYSMIECDNALSVFYVTIDHILCVFGSAPSKLKRLINISNHLSNLFEVENCHS